MSSDDVLAAAPVDDSGDLDASTGKIFSCSVTIGVRAEHHSLSAGTYGVQVDQATNRTRQHDARFVVSCEHVRSLDEPRRDDQYLRPRLDQALHRSGMAALHNGAPIVFVASCDRRVGEHLDPGGEDSGRQFGGERSISVVTPQQMPTQRMSVFDEHYVGTSLRGCDCCGHAGRPATGHHNIRVGVSLVVIAKRRVQVDRATGSEACEYLLVRWPQTLRTNKCLVVEPGSQESTDQTIRCLDVVLEGRPRVLCFDLHALGEQPMPRPYVGVVGDLNESVRVPVVRREIPTGPVVLHASRHDAHRVGAQCRSDRVSGEARQGGTVPAEPHGG